MTEIIDEQAPLFTLEDLSTIQLGVLLPLAQKNGLEEALAAKRDQVVGMIYVAQMHNPELRAALHEKLRDIASRHESVNAHGNVGNIRQRKGVNKDGKPRATSAVFGAVALVHKTCDEMKGQPRKAVIEKLVSMGVNKNTAATQYAAWNKKQTAVAS